MHDLQKSEEIVLKSISVNSAKIFDLKKSAKANCRIRETLYFPNVLIVLFLTYV